MSALDNELYVFSFDSLATCMSGERRGLLANAHGVLLQNAAHFFDRIVSHPLSAGLLDESPELLPWKVHRFA